MNPKRPFARRTPPRPNRVLTVNLTAEQFDELSVAAKRVGMGEADWAQHLITNGAQLANTIENLFPRKETTP